MYSNGIAGLNTPIGQNQMYPGSQQIPSQYATPSQTPISSSALNASYEPKTNAYTGEMNLAGGGIAALRYDDGGDVQQQTPQAESTWTPDQPVKLQSMDQMLSGDASGKEFNPTEHGYKWNGQGFVNPNGSTISVNPDGSVSQATPAYKDYEFNGQYWNPAGENVAWHPEKNQSAYKLGGVEVPINPANMKGIAAYTDQNGNPQMQINKEGLPVFTEPEGIRQSPLWMDEVGAPLLASLAMGGAGALGAGTTLATEAAGGLGTGVTGMAGAAQPISYGQAMTGFNAAKNAANFVDNPTVGGGVNAGISLARAAPMMMAAKGGVMHTDGGIANLGSYSDGGQLLKGPGDGMSDHIPATIGGKQPARLADSEFVLPADIVSHLGNGSTDAGAKILYKMMDRIRMARTGTKKQGKQIKPDRYLPA